MPSRHSDAYAAYQSKFCAAMPSPTYRAAHAAWYGRVRQLLRQLRKPFLDITFNESTRGLVHLLERVYAHAHLRGAQRLAAREVVDLTRARASVLNETCQPPPMGPGRAGSKRPGPVVPGTNAWARTDLRGRNLLNLPARTRRRAAESRW